MAPIWLEPMKRWNEFSRLRQDALKGSEPVAVFGLSDSQKCHFVSSLLYPIHNNCLYITYSDVQAQAVYDDLCFFYGDKVELLPSKEVSFYSVAAHSREVASRRLKVLTRLTLDKGIIVVASIEALLFYLVPFEVYRKSVFSIKVGDVIPLYELAASLVDMGYERVSAVEGRGQFCLRGGILDIFALTEDNPYRLEFFDEEVDSIRQFDAYSQRSIDNLHEITISPARELILSEAHLKQGKAAIYNTLSRYMDKKPADWDSGKLRKKLGYIIEQLDQNIYDDTLDSFFPFFYSNSHSILDYLGDDTFIVIDDPLRIRERYETWEFEFTENFKNLLEQGEVLPDQACIFLEYADFIAKCKGIKKLIIQTLPRDNPDFKPKVVYQFMSRSIPSYHNKISMLAEDISYWKSKNYSIILLTGTSSRGQGLISALREMNIDALPDRSQNDIILPGQVIVMPGSISKGFEYIDAKLVIVSDSEIYSIQKKKTAPKKRKRKLDPFTDLKVGDYVVHENHGIGKYLGIENLEINGQKKDYLYIQYAGTDRLYVPTDQMDIIQPYIGLGDSRPKLSKLGGVEWQKAKSKARQSAKDLADELIKLYARRQDASGYSFSPDTDWQRQFEEQFPYEETEDQLQAIKDIKGDMESKKVMDRLLCGDVGYGKTEVAIRAAFKAVMDGKQVALMAPTTILAQQHYNTFLRRFGDFPFKIEVISRFKTPKEQKLTIKSLKEGNVDVIIGTHRLLGKDVKFNDLGLLIIDEEQRFGVAHKEMIKQLKNNIDVLTLTATPIPRTLHMSLVGIRDISVIETPPEDRHPVQTYVVEYNTSLIRDAILREINRGGQVYFVYNRVKTMDRMQNDLQALVPEARTAIAHGQMSENLLEKVMMDFYDGKYDVLICSAIIENGLDIPNVNTIIIYDADMFGLSQLYQLRGRVGRSSRRAYAYFTYKKDKVLSEVAEKRLQAIKDFTEFGAGFKIAMRDMEIRGSGNLLGREQHGHMSAVGYDLYCKLLEQAVSEVKGASPAPELQTTVDIKVDAYIDSSYISNESQKIEIYKKIASISSFEDKQDIEDEVIDRFSDIPQSTQNLIDIAYIKSTAQQLGIGEIIQQNREIKFKPFADQFINTNRTAHPVSISIKNLSDSDILKEIEKFLDKIKHLQKG